MHYRKTVIRMVAGLSIVAAGAGCAGTAAAVDKGSAGAAVAP